MTLSLFVIMAMLETQAQSDNADALMLSSHAVAIG